MAECAAKLVTVIPGDMAKSEQAHDAFFKQKIKDAYADSRPRLCLGEAFDELRKHASAYKAAQH